MADLESLTITALRDELDLMREVTRLLNVADNRRIKNFKDLAKECGIPAEKYRSLQPPCTESPTEEVLQDIVGRKPFYTVRELFIDLREMNRKDAIEAISIYFVGKVFVLITTSSNDRIVAKQSSLPRCSNINEAP